MTPTKKRIMLIWSNHSTGVIWLSCRCSRPIGFEYHSGKYRNQNGHQLFVFSNIIRFGNINLVCVFNWNILVICTLFNWWQKCVDDYVKHNADVDDMPTWMPPVLYNRSIRNIRNIKIKLLCGTDFFESMGNMKLWPIIDVSSIVWYLPHGNLNSSNKWSISIHLI